MSNRLEIILSEIDNKPVSLSSMSVEALDSFMTVVSSLKKIAISTIVEDELTFAILEGSALCAVEAPQHHMECIYGEVDLAIQGKSTDKEITRNLRTIQSQLKRQEFGYKFRYRKNINDVNSDDDIIDLHSILISSKAVSAKREKRGTYSYKLKVLTGFLNQIGGNNPNYHFNYGLKDSVTIDCTMDEAKEVNKHLYQTVESLIISKEPIRGNKKSEYYHKLILENNRARIFRQFLESYNKEDVLINKLTIIYDFVDDVFEKHSFGHEVLRYLLVAFNDVNFNINEIKTLLVISKPFKDHEEVSEARKKLLKTYQNMRN